MELYLSLIGVGVAILVVLLAVLTRIFFMGVKLGKFETMVMTLWEVFIADRVIRHGGTVESNIRMEAEAFPDEVMEGLRSVAARTNSKGEISMIGSQIARHSQLMGLLRALAQERREELCYVIAKGIYYVQRDVGQRFAERVTSTTRIKRFFRR